MARIRMSQHRMTFKEGCEMYLLDCRQRNLREGTIRHYRQSFLRFSRYFDDDMPHDKVDQDAYSTYVLQLCDELDNSVSINSHLRDLMKSLKENRRNTLLFSKTVRSIDDDFTHAE